jgi:hypothetical protein
MACTGSIQAAPPGDKGSSLAAATGTLLHALSAERLLPGYAQRGVGTVEVVDGYRIEVTQEHIEAVEFYVQTVQDDEQPGDRVWTEMPLLRMLQQIHPDLGGTADRVRYRPSTKELRVFDAKFGSGTYVEATDNKQMKMYALGVMLEIALPVEEVICTIVQPLYEGARPVRDDKFSAHEIMAFIADVQAAAVRTHEKNSPLVAGDHCGFCPARRDCPELKKREVVVMAADFSNLPSVPMAKLAEALRFIPLVKERIKAIEEHAYAEAQKGEIPGFKLVDKRATRRWKDEDELRAWAQTNLTPDPRVIYAPQEVLSPAQLEKKLGKDSKKSLADLIESKSSGTVLVPVEDDRPPAKRITAADFPALPGNPLNF